MFPGEGLEGTVRIPSGCAVAGVIDRSGAPIGGAEIVAAIAVMHERSNGLGGGFAGYGIYPHLADCFALHLLFLDEAARAETERLIAEVARRETAEPIPTRQVATIESPPLLWRYFIQPHGDDETAQQERVFQLVNRINAGVRGAFVVSSGKNLGVFKGVGYPEEMAEFFRLEDYAGHTWLAHGRFPTNTPGWWGGAHPFSLLDWSVVHNGEVSSYGANLRYLRPWGYEIVLQTDTEVITYALDLLVRRHELPIGLAAKVLAPPFWDEIERFEPEARQLHTALRSTYGSLGMNGPFSILVGFTGGMMALNDRLKLRSLAVATKGTRLYAASEEAAIRAVCPRPERVWFPRGGEPVIATVAEGALSCSA